MLLLQSFYLGLLKFFFAFGGIDEIFCKVGEGLELSDEYVDLIYVLLLSNEGDCSISPLDFNINWYFAILIDREISKVVNHLLKEIPSISVDGLSDIINIEISVID